MAAYTSQKSGNWSAVDTWGGGPPGNGDTAVIAAGHTVTIDGNVTVGNSPSSETSYVVTIYGTLQWQISPGSDWTFRCKGSISIEAGGRFQIGTSTQPIPASQKATLWIDAGATPGGYLIRLATPSGAATQPRFIVYGAESYHMSGSKYKARLAANAASGATQITVDREVYWEAGDVITLGFGGSKTTPLLSSSGRLSGYGDERVTIASRVSPTTYTLTAGLTYNHLAGDIVAHMSRNVVIMGNPSYGFCIYKSPLPYRVLPTSDSDHGFIDLNWVQLRYAATGMQTSTYNYAAIWVGVGDSTWAQEITADHYKLRYVVFDTPYTASGSPAARGILFRNCGYAHITTPTISDVVFYEYFFPIDTAQLGTTYASNGYFTFGDLVMIKVGPSGITTYRGCWRLGAVWMSINADTSSSYGIYTYSSGGPELYIREFLCHNGYYGLYYTANAMDFSGNYARITIDSAEFLNVRVPINETTDNVCLVVNNGVFLFFSAVTLAADTCAFTNCSFDGSFDTSGALSFSATKHIDILLKKCTFGTAVRNQHSNVVFSGTSNCNTFVGRVSFEDCDVKIPVNYSSWNTTLGQWLSAVIKNGSGHGGWYSRSFNYAFAVEFVRLRVFDASDVEQIAINFPGVTHFGFIGNGGQLRNENTEIIDGTFATKLSPWDAFTCCPGTFVKPYQIPVQAGKTITVKIKFKATQAHSEELFRPAAHLFGCGIDAVSYMAAVVNAWNQVTVSGTALCAGMVDFWVTGGFGFWSSGGHVVPWQQQTIYVDGLEVIIS